MSDSTPFSSFHEETQPSSRSPDSKEGPPSNPSRAPSFVTTSEFSGEKIRRLLRMGIEKLGVENGYLSQISLATGSQTIVEACSPHPLLEKGITHEIGATYCRKTILSANPFSLYNAHNQGWTDDPAYKTFGLASYLGTKLVVNDQLYGTLCFADSAPREAPFRETDLAILKRIADAIEDVLTGLSLHNTAPADIARKPDLLDRIFKTSPLAIAFINQEGQFVRVSERANEILGLEKSEVTDRTYNDPEWQTTTPDGDPLPDKDLPFARVKDTQEPIIDVQHAIEWPDGTRRVLSVSGAPLHDADGAFIGGIFHIDDITSQRQTKLSLRESEERFRGVFENAALGIALMDAHGQIIEANPALESMLGYETTANLEGRNLRSILHSPDKSSGSPLSEDVLAGSRASYQVEKRFVRRNGGVFWGHLTVSRVDGPGVGKAIGMIEDIDQRKTQKEELRQFRKAVTQAHEAVLLLEDPPSAQQIPLIDYANPAFASLTGYDPEEISGRSLDVLFGGKTDPRVVCDLRTAVEKGCRHEGEAITYRKDGTPFINRWSIAPVRDEDGTITRWVSVQRDVTEQRQTGKRLLEVQEEERRRIDQEMHDHMGGLLTTLQMTVELARLDDGNATNHLDEIEQCVSELATVTRTISRRLHPRALDKHGLPRALSQLMDLLQERHNLSIEFYCALEPETRFASIVEMTAYQAVQEALLYALQNATPSSLEVGLSTQHDELRLEVICRNTRLSTPSDDESGALRLRDISKWICRLDGTMRFDSPNGSDTRVLANLPLSIAPLPS